MLQGKPSIFPPHSSLPSPSFSLSWAAQFVFLFLSLPLPPSLTLRLSCSLYSFLSHKLHNVPHSSCSSLLLCSMQTSCLEPTSDIIPLSRCCHLHHGAWSPGREGRDGEVVGEGRRRKEAEGEGRTGSLGRDGGLCGLPPTGQLETPSSAKTPVFWGKQPRRPSSHHLRNLCVTSLIVVSVNCKFNSYSMFSDLHFYSIIIQQTFIIMPYSANLSLSF